MKNIDLDIKYEEYSINGNESDPIRINVCDANMLTRIKEAAKKCEETLKNFTEKTGPEELAEADRAVRAVVDEAFNSDVASKAFGRNNCITTATADGMTLAEAFFKKLCPIIAEDIKASVNARRIKLNGGEENAQTVDMEKVAHYTKPITERPEKPNKPFIPYAEPKRFDVSALSAEEKAELLRQLVQ